MFSSNVYLEFPDFHWGDVGSNEIVLPVSEVNANGKGKWCCEFRENDSSIAWFTRFRLLQDNSKRTYCFKLR